MKIIAMSATLVLLYTGAALAQAQGDKPEVSPPPGLKIVTGNESKHARHADARHCLDLKTEVQIIRCAERYRYHKS